MMNPPSLDQLKQAVALKEQIAALESQLNAILGGGTLPSFTPAPPITSRVGRPPGKQGVSEEGKARIAVAQKARWAKFRESKGTVPSITPAKKRNISPESRARMAAAAKARWARYRKEKGG
jgi:hypothetical protein